MEVWECLVSAPAASVALPVPAVGQYLGSRARRRGPAYARFPPCSQARKIQNFNLIRSQIMRLPLPYLTVFVTFILHRCLIIRAEVSPAPSSVSAEVKEIKEMVASVQESLMASVRLIQGSCIHPLDWRKASPKPILSIYLFPNMQIKWNRTARTSSPSWNRGCRRWRSRWRAWGPRRSASGRGRTCGTPSSTTSPPGRSS